MSIQFCGPFGGATVVQKGKRKMQVFESQALAFCLVPGAGIEPARIAPLVFETSASTDSAIRAGGQNWKACPALWDCKDIAKCLNLQELAEGFRYLRG